MVARSVMRAAHPHSRGENCPKASSTHHQSGSSPLTRGKPPIVGAYTMTGGLIPTHAGKTAQRRDAGAHPAAHPHSRGENAAMMRSVLLIQGSSPLTRGKPRRSARGGRVRRLIPTHAGKTRLLRLARSCRAAHPHSRGENPPRRIRQIDACGSSPLTRGKPCRSQAEALDRRLIPTHAGKTPWGVYASVRFGAHPHSRGENGVSARRRPRPAGSSPLTRGKQRIP